MINYYSILELSNFASGEEVKKAHRLLSKRYHPDLNPGNPVAEEKFKQVQHAYEQLNNSYKKSYYDDILRMNLYSPPQSHHTYTNTQSHSSYHQPSPSYATYASASNGGTYEEEAGYTPEEQKRNLLIRWAIVAVIASIIILGAIFSHDSSSPNRRGGAGVVHDNEKYNLDPYNSTGVTVGDTASHVLEVFGIPDDIKYESSGVEVWSYEDKLIMVQHHKVIWAYNYPELEKIRPDTR